jgi:hypothetical protein
MLVHQTEKNTYKKQKRPIEGTKLVELNKMYPQPQGFSES